MAIIKRMEESKATWKEIQGIINSGKAAELLKPGTEIIEELKDGRKAVIVVTAVNLYKDGEVIFGFRNTIGNYVMNEDWTNKGGWPKSEMRRYLNKEVVNLLPDELVGMISPSITRQVRGEEVMASEDLLFLPSEYEVQGETIFSEYNGTDKQFPFYKERANRIVVDEDGDPDCWWLASPYASSTTYFCYVSYDGNANAAAAASDSFGVAPGFRICKS